jgi:LytS/YehU family sensor histidine kinase
VVNVGAPLQVLTFIFSSPKFAFYVIFQALAVYFNLYFLIPNYLERAKYLQYLLYLAFTIASAAAIIATGYYLNAALQDSTLLAMYGNGNLSHYFLTYTLPSTLTSMFLAMSIKLAKNWIQAKHRSQLLEKEKLETELKFLRSQFNPHFLFNTINSIFVLIHKNPDMASESLAKFSDLLRYQLYECNEHEIPLGQELTYVENYIELERLRQDSNSLDVKTQLAPHHKQDLTIAPFVLIPFVENAFKHVSQRKDHTNWIHMKLSIDRHQLHFSISNSVSVQTNTAREVGRHHGIGLKNVQRRLNLIYNDDHELMIQQEAGQFRVILTLNLHEHKSEAALTDADTN